MTKLKTAAIALTFAAALAATSGQAQAGWHGGGAALGLGIVAGAAIGAAAASSAYGPGYEPAYRCRYIERMDRWGNLRTMKVCEAY